MSAWLIEQVDTGLLLNNGQFCEEGECFQIQEALQIIRSSPLAKSDPSPWRLVERPVEIYAEGLDHG